MTLLYIIQNVSPRELIYIPAWVRTDNVNLQPYIGVLWYNGVTLLSLPTYTQNGFAPAINTWYPIALAALAYDASVPLQMPVVGSPALSRATANAIQIYLGVRSTANNATGNVWFDVVDRGSPVITVVETGMNKLNVSVSYQAGYL